MRISNLFAKLHKHALIALSAGSVALAVTHSAQAEPFQTPLFLVSQVKPVTMLNMSRDHQLFFKLYDDYSDITDSRATINNVVNANYGKDPDGAPDTTYVHGFDYYGYFDSYKCYTYSTTDNRFNPASFTTNKYCNSSASNQWSGNFLNWASMTRVDAIRKMLYGGMRFIDTTSATVLERAYLPTDAHSFAKYYAGADLPQLTPFAVNTGSTVAREQGITICNTSDPGTATLSQAATSTAGARPLLRVARGNYSLWATSERWQCRWRSSISDADPDFGVNGNTAASGIDAYSDSPIDDHKLGTGSATGEYVARVSVCVTNLLALSSDKNNEKCLGYAGDTVFKPTGLLQEYANTQHFGLITGSYGKNKSGGVLRKQVGSITDEINSNGIFQVPASGKSIIKTLDSLRIYGYRYGQGLGLYHNNSHVVNTPGASQNDGCLWGTSSFSNGQCVNWGNPQAEIYLESLRYLSGAASPQFDSDDSVFIPGLDRVTSWVDPITPAPAGNYCAPINIIQFDASMTSYDSDNLDNVPATIGDLDTATNFIGTSENIHNNSYFVGENGANNNQLCTPKSITSLATVKGSCPEAPRLEGSYKIAGLAHKARSAGIGSDRKKPKTYGVSLAAAVPNVVVPVPGSTQKISILPACRNIDFSPNGNCAIVDFKVVSQISDSPTENSGKLYVSWEDTEQGGDYDQDMWGVIDYKVTATNVTVTTDVVAESTIYDMGFGYIIGGTTNDGFHVHSGIEGFSSGDCVNCQTGDAATSKHFTVGSSNAKLLEPALKYAAKWGGYKNDNATAASIATSNPETYFKAVDPRKLEESLRAVFDALSRTGSSTTVASNSTRIDSDTNIFQALFDSRDWSGSLQAFPIKKDGTIDAANKAWDTNDTLKPSENISRNIYTYNGTAAVALTASGFDTAPTALRNAFKLTAEADYTKATLRYQWLIGKPIESLRPRTYLLGDIINSDPAYAGANNQRYNLLPAAYGASSYDAYLQDPENTASKVNRKKAVFVGANDGMLHAFNVANGQELFAFIPRGVYSKLASLSKTDYQHAYTVDGPVYVGDVFIEHNGVKTWRTLVGGTLGAGGRGAYLLDVTDVLNGSSNAPRVIFDIYAGDSNPTLSNDLGYSTSKMLIVPTANESWTAIFGNGTESVNGIAKLIAINVQNPSVFNAITTKNTITGNGLSGAALLPNGDGVSTYAYAGDIKGNMWKFDLTSSNQSQWKASFNGNPLIKVIDGSGNPQPITGTPTLGRNAKKMVGNGANAVPSVMVYFGTGRYSEIADLSDLSIQSIYAIADTNTALSLTQSNRNQMLQEKGISNETATMREVYPDETPVGTESYAVDWHLSGVHGWFLDLIYTTAKGERVIAKPLLLFDRLIVNTFIPEAYQCSNGGSGWLMELTGVGDRFIGLTVLKNNKNGRLLEPIKSSLLPIMSGENLFIVGSSLTSEAENPGSALEVFEGQAGAGSRGRMSWRQIK